MAYMKKMRGRRRAMGRAMMHGLGDDVCPQCYSNCDNLYSTDDGRAACYGTCDSGGCADGTLAVSASSGTSSTSTSSGGGGGGSTSAIGAGIGTFLSRLFGGATPTIMPQTGIDPTTLILLGGGILAVVLLTSKD